MRQSYWARNYSGHPKFSSFLPNEAHFALADWEQKGKVGQIVTQNVDRLHHKAGSENVVELHGEFNFSRTKVSNLHARSFSAYSNFMWN